MKTIKYIIGYSFLLALASCSGEQEKEKPIIKDTLVETKPESVKVDSIQEVQEIPPFPHYDSVMEMMNAEDGYAETDSTLELLSSVGNKVHIRISEKSGDGEPEKRTKWLVRRSIILTTFNVFAKTDADIITITSFPILVNEEISFVRFMREYTMTIEVTRDEAMDVIKQFLPIPKSDFKELYFLADNKWYESTDLIHLTQSEIDNVIKEFKKN